MQTKLLLVLAFITSSSAFAAERMGPGHGVGPAHPSAYLCSSLKGKTINVYTDAGEFSICRLELAEVSTMGLWYSLKVGIEKADAVFLEHPEAQGPAARNPEDYCRFVGGRVEVVMIRRESGKIKTCLFDTDGDRSRIGLNTLFRGPSHPGNAQLAKLLQKAKR